jgi:WD40 repeat protein
MEVRHHGAFIADYEPGVAVTCHQVVPARRMVVAGLANGSVAVWRRKPDAPSGPGRVETRPQMLHGHSGLVCGIHLADEPGIGGVGGYLLFSWSADRTIRVWDPEATSPEQACAQTLRAHGGTITGLIVAGDCLVTSSTDKTLRIWRPEAGRELMLYPWYNPHQTIRDSECWINAIALNPAAEGGALYVGDEQGALSAYRATAAHGEGLQLTKWRR